MSPNVRPELSRAFDCLGVAAREIGEWYSRQNAARQSRAADEAAILAAVRDAIAPAAASLCGPPGVLELVARGSQAVCLTSAGPILLFDMAADGSAEGADDLVRIVQRFGLGSILEAILDALRSQVGPGRGREGGALRDERAAARVAAILLLLKGA